MKPALNTSRLCKPGVFSAILILLLSGGCSDNKSKPSLTDPASSTQQKPKPVTPQRDELAKRLVKAGELFVLGGSQAETDSCFNVRKFKFHGADHNEADYAGLNNYFKSVRAAFDDRSIKRGILVAEGNYIACQTRIEGKCVREFTQSPVGPIQPNGQRVVWDLINIFRFDEEGKIIEEWVRGDDRNLVRQLGATGN